MSRLFLMFAVPFSLKLIESLLAESPRHHGLLFAAWSDFTQYAYAFVNQDAGRAGRWPARWSLGRADQLFVE